MRGYRMGKYICAHTKYTPVSLRRLLSLGEYVRLHEQQAVAAIHPAPCLSWDTYNDSLGMILMTEG